MDPARWQAARELFDQLVDLAPARREQRLAETARTDPELRREVERLLAADAAADALLGRIDEALAPPAAPHTGAEDPLVMVGRDVAHFRVIEPIASGGMGVVYRAEDRQLRREIALKFPLPHLFADDRARRRFLREGRAAGALDHPNVCGVYELGETDDGHLFIAMPFCAGETLKARLARDGPLPPALAVGIAQSIARGLGAAHAAGVVHRDVKPGNVMLLADGGLKVLDFGLAFAHFIDTSVSRTSAGTAAYMAPEQLLGESVDARADLWALGVVLYEMLAGRLPFVGAHLAAVHYAVMHEDPVPLASVCPDLPRALVAVVDQLLLKNPARRPATAAEVDAVLDAALADASTESPRRRPRRRTIALLAGAFLATAVAGVALFRPRSNETTAPRAVAASAPTTNGEAYRFYQRGREFERRSASRENLDNARKLYLGALALDPTFALAHARLSIVLGGMLPWHSVEERRALRSQSRAEAEAALRARPTLGEAHLALGHVFANAQRLDSAMAEFERAKAAIPDSAEVHVAIGSWLLTAGRLEDAVASFERAARLDSSNVGQLRDLAMAQSRLRRYQAAIRTWDRILPLTPDDHEGALIRGWVFFRWLGTTDSLSAILKSLPPDWDDAGRASWARFNVARIERHPDSALVAATAMHPDTAWDGLFFRPRALLQAQAYAGMGDQRRARDLFRRARAQLAQAIATRPWFAPLHTALGLSYAGLGQRARAIIEADTAIALAVEPNKVTLYGTAMMGEAAEIRVRIGDLDGALALLERLLSIHAGREASVPSLRKDPVWDPLRADPRFEQMLRRSTAR